MDNSHDNFMNDLMHEFNMLNLESEKKSISKFIKNANEINCNNDEDVNFIVSEFSQLKLAQKPDVVNNFYMFILKCINRDRKYIGSTIFIPPEPPLCR